MSHHYSGPDFGFPRIATIKAVFSLFNDINGRSPR